MKLLKKPKIVCNSLYEIFIPSSAIQNARKGTLSGLVKKISDFPSIRHFRPYLRMAKTKRPSPWQLPRNVKCACSPPSHFLRFCILTYNVRVTFLNLQSNVYSPQRIPDSYLYTAFEDWTRGKTSIWLPAFVNQKLDAILRSYILKIKRSWRPIYLYRPAWTLTNKIS